MTETKLKTAGAPPKPDWDNYSQKPRIPERQKANIADQYEKEVAKGRNREEVLEELAEKAGRSTREVERYVSAARRKREVKTNILIARQQEWNKLAAMAESAANRLLGPFSMGDLWESIRGRAKEPSTEPGQYQPLECNPADGSNHVTDEPKGKELAKEPSSVSAFLDDCVSTVLPFDISSDSKQFLWKCLMSHLNPEFPGFETQVEDWRSTSTFYIRWKNSGSDARLPCKGSEIEDKLRTLTKELRQVLTLVAERRTFKGSCDMCKDW